MYPLPYRCTAIKGQLPKARAKFDPLVIDPLAVMVVDSDEEDLALAFGDQKLPVQIEGEQEDDGSFDPNTTLAISDVVDPWRVIPHLEASPLRLLGGPSVTDDSVSKDEIKNARGTVDLGVDIARLEARRIIKSIVKPKEFLDKEQKALISRRSPLLLLFQTLRSCQILLRSMKH
ncbi:hypothetical protein AMTR_s00057p00192000 [Amborella trichopoda]|uniref:Uncharacterized protein n=1 Tax=Amborella trichopoda TaxID=13333 RepID=U5D3E9_AMBTC|nr:hypothetical protein AMTR_s00057p00192000 [Amborella trichopoda]